MSVEVQNPIVPPLSFTLRLDADRSIAVEEARGRSGGLFRDLSSAIRFVETQCEAHHCPVAMRFDQTLAFIRAAG